MTIASVLAPPRRGAARVGKRVLPMEGAVLHARMAAAKVSRANAVADWASGRSREALRWLAATRERKRSPVSRCEAPPIERKRPQANQDRLRAAPRSGEPLLELARTRCMI